MPLAVTPGEPAGIGPDICLQYFDALRRGAASATAVPVFVADPALLEQRAGALGLALRIEQYRPGDAPDPDVMQVLPVELPAPCRPGVLDPANAGYVLETLRTAAGGCLEGRFGALVTGPVQKSVIADAGFAFTGHTEFLAELCGRDHVVMMLATDRLRVALVTTHLPLARVAEAITGELLERIIRILHGDLIAKFGIAAPRILVAGLNPHAGEHGHLGREEIEVIEPALEKLRGEGIDLTGPLPADTLFTPRHLEQADAVLAMYHDQGLPVLKYQGFGRAVNVTLGLPIIRTSVDHGTALDLAGSGRAESGSLTAALRMADSMCRNRHSA